MRKDKTIPSIVGVIVLFLGLVTGVYLSLKVNPFSSKASSSCAPDNLQITNLTHNSFDVSFATNADCLSQVTVNGRNVFDIRQSQSSTLHRTHYFRITNLQAEQNYNFIIVSGGQEYNQPSFQVKTPKTPSGQLPSSNLAWGRILESNNLPAQDAIIYLNIPGASPLSAFAGSDGRWNISLAYSLSADKSSWFKPQPGVGEEIIVISPPISPTIINSDTSHNYPVPDIILGRNQDTSITPPLPSSVGQIPTLIIPTAAIGPLTIDNPKEGESITANLPDFFGRCTPGSTLNLTLEPAPSQTGQITCPASGPWHWTPPKNLAPGPFRLTITSLGNTVSRNFTVINSDYGLAFTASSSGSLITPSPSPTPTPTLSPTAVPTNEPTATPIVKKTLPGTSS